jgi:hypothetical protein
MAYKVNGIVISGFRLEIAENCVHHHSLRNNPEERISQWNSNSIELLLVCNTLQCISKSVTCRNRSERDEVSNALFYFSISIQLLLF